MELDVFIKKYESVVLKSLSVMMAVVVLLAIIDLAWFLVEYLVTPPIGLIEVSQLLEIFGLFLLVLIGIELLDTIQTYRQERTVRVEVAIVVALLAISRKIIILDYKDLTSFTLFHVGVLILALAAAFFLLRTSRRSRSEIEKSGAVSSKASET